MALNFLGNVRIKDNVYIQLTSHVIQDGSNSLSGNSENAFKLRELKRVIRTTKHFLFLHLKLINLDM